VRGADLYSPNHPLVQRGIDNLVAATQQALQNAHSIIVGFIDDEIVVDGSRLPRGTAALVGFARDLRERDIEKITLSRGLTREELKSFIAVLGDRKSKVPLPDQLAARGVRNIALGRVVIEEVTDEQAGIVAAKRIYTTAVQTAESLWESAKAGEQPDPGAARRSSTACAGW
jgi:hypothetical protein